MPPFPHTAHVGGGLTGPQPAELVSAPRRTPIEEAIREATSMHRMLPTPERMAALTSRLRAFIGAAASDLEAAVRDRPHADPIREDAIAVVKEGRYRLGIGPGDGYASAITLARSLGWGADALLKQQRRLQRAVADGVVAVAGTSGPGVIALGAAESCTACLGLVELRGEAERRHDWAAMRRADARLTAHRASVHAG
ncbi:DUF6415 family natural product biosynthesis protein [Streptomyces sp. ISL-11]|uniref:DUF6415 family natural product biosynthesis protein n=1 Tax=Streptomyces sp. ISL-11 TaxID=2819174 RepID=UPI001BE8A1FC|nr:DUF6415 family natural product biosynthesis protein [Streptomyces sp. ISL-11]MBT2382130.1 hypothetical protein [Streptomyces sp. ISL-11]